MEHDKNCHYVIGTEKAKLPYCTCHHPTTWSDVEEGLDKKFPNLCMIVIPKNGTHYDRDVKEDVKSFYLTALTTLLKEAMPEEYPPESINYEEDNRESGYNQALSDLKAKLAERGVNI